VVRKEAGGWGKARHGAGGQGKAGAAGEAGRHKNKNEELVRGVQSVQNVMDLPGYGWESVRQLLTSVFVEFWREGRV